MDKSTIKTYAVEARRKLIEAVKLKAQQLYIFEDSAKTLRPGTESERLQADGIFLSSEQLKARERLYAELLHEDMPYKPAIFNRVMENVACTWFNRLIALRIMEVNDWLPSNTRILSSRESGRVEPDAVREVERLDYVNQAKIAELRANADINAAEKLYKYILISQCNALSAILPGMFEKENDYTELLLPDALLSKGGIVNDLVTLIHEDNFNIEKEGQIEIIGWLYQFYISEKKDEVFAGLKKNIKINKDTIPAATQLFTPEWIVKYMVENSLGRLWLDSHPNAELRAKWKYYVDEAEQEPEVAEQLRILRSQSPVKRPEDIKLIDPCMGSGHILVYAFDVLFQIYQSEGYSEREIPNLILQNNLYGLDIDDRAGQLAYFALMMKARSYNRRFFRQDNVPQPMVYTVPETKLYIFGLEKWLGASMTESNRKASFEDLKYLGELFSKGKEYGSLLKIEREIDFDRLRKYVRDFAVGQITLEDVDFSLQAEAFDRVIDVAEILSQKYDVVVTNPPYMGSTGMSSSISAFVKSEYPDSKNDLFATFIERGFMLAKTYGYCSLVTMQSWLSGSTYEKLRLLILKQKTICDMVHMGNMVMGIAFGTTATVFRNTVVHKFKGTYQYITMNDLDDKNSPVLFPLLNERFSQVDNSKFLNIEGYQIAYWLSDAALKCFDYSSLSKKCISGGRNKTHNDDLYIRLHWEVESTSDKWVPYGKGGDYRKYYGNELYKIDWSDSARDFYQQHGGLLNSRFWNKEGITWSFISSYKPSFRIKRSPMIYSSVSPTIFSNTIEFDAIVLGFLNTSVSLHFQKALSPTVGNNVGEILQVPFIEPENHAECIKKIVYGCIDISKSDWDSFETSWDFQEHPLVRWQKYGAEFHPDENVNLISRCFTLWSVATKENFYKLKANEEELNRIFIDIYGLQDELTPEVEDKDVTVRKADLGRDIRSFISYAVGCMFGRYSLNEPGLVFAGGAFDMSRYKSFMPEDDNIIPIGSADYFDDDIVVRFIEFVRAVYGDNTLGENLSFIADALYPNGNGSPQERIRRYFLNDFYKDHVKIYQKRPIYWLFDSGKKDGFKALFYLHRYDKYTVARARTDYLHPLQRKYEAEIKRLEMLSGSTDNVREKAAYRKEIDVLLSKIDECRVYDQVVSHIAHQQIELDLDDGVKVNYEKFQGVEVPKDNGKTETMDLLGRI